MCVAFTIFKFFPYGGSARDLAKIASLCLQRGHEVRIYALEWEGPRFDGVETVVLATRGVRSHVRQRRFSARVAVHVAAHPVDLLVGMNKMPGVDVYYAADSCFEDKARTQRPWPYRLTARYRHYADFERAVFREHGQTRILTIAPNQDVAFKALYRTPAHRFHRLPPGIERDRATATVEAGQALRAELGVAHGDILLLFIGSGFVKKGLGRVIRGVGALPASLRERVRLFVLGDDKAARFERLARRSRLAAQVRFMGGRDDVPAWLQAADALALPALDEAAGMVILEAASSGLPVLVTANCGYAPLVEGTDVGIVTPSPFEPGRFNADLERLLTSSERPAWSRRGRELAVAGNLHGMARSAVDALERIAAHREAPLVTFCAFGYSPADPKYRPLTPVAEACRDRGMNVHVVVGNGQRRGPAGLDVVVAPVAAMTRRKRFERYCAWVTTALVGSRAGCTVGFEAMAGLDILLGDGLRPGLGRAQAASGKSREALRANYGFEPDDLVFAMAGGDLVGHGYERLVTALGGLPEALRDRCRVLAAGRLPRGFGAIPQVLNLRDQVSVDGDLAALDAIEAADAFVDLAYRRSSNAWTFDALAAGRPVLTHDGLTESRLVRDAQGGIVLAWPFRQTDLDKALLGFVCSAETRAQFSANASRYAAAPDHYCQADQVTSRIEDHLQQRGIGVPLPA